jgi:pyruvate/2-oxoglutarate dehydrogenase complex dihydrolipoamide acyltransferase (E2) component
LPVLEGPDTWKPDVRIGTEDELRQVLASIGRGGILADDDEQLLLLRRLNAFFGIDWLDGCVALARTTTDPKIRQKSDGTERTPLARFVRACWWTANLARIDGYLTSVALTWLFARDKPGQPRPHKPPHLRPLGTMHYEQMRRQAKAEKQRRKEHREGVERRAQKRVARAAKRAAIRLAKKRRAAERNRSKRAAKAARKAAAKARNAPLLAVQTPPPAAPPPSPPRPVEPPRRRIVTLPPRDPPPPAPRRRPRQERIAAVEVEVLPVRPPK